MSENIFSNFYNKVLSFFQKEKDSQEETAKDTATNRLKLVLMQDRSNLDGATMQKMREQLITVISKYIEIDQEALDLNLESDGDEIALMLNIPVIRARTPEEIDEIEKAEQEAKETQESEESEETEEEDTSSEDKNEETKDSTNETDEKEVESEETDENSEETEQDTEESGQEQIEVEEDTDSDEDKENISTTCEKKSNKKSKKAQNN